MKLILFLTLTLRFHLMYAQDKPHNYNSLDSFMEAQNRATIGKDFPMFDFDNGERKLNNDSLKGKVVLINFWFEGCHPCMMEMRSLNNLFQSLKDNPEFEFVSITYDKNIAIERVRKNFDLKFDVISIDQNECTRLNQGRGYPTNIILSRKGRIIYFSSGGFTDREKAEEYVQKELGMHIKSELKNK